MVTPTEGRDIPTPTGAVAEYERALIAERLRRGRLQRFQAGTLLPWTRPPYGYAVDPEEPRALRGVRPDPGAAALVAELFALYLEPGQSVAGVAKHFMAVHAPTPGGGARWNTASVRKILTNPVYIGAVYAGRTRVRPVERCRSALASVGCRATSAMVTAPEEWLLVGQVPALVTPDVFARVQGKLATNRQRARRHNTAPPYLLRALVSCGHCRSACVGRTRHQYSYYDCAGKAHPVRSSRDQLVPRGLAQRATWTRRSGPTCARC